MPSPENGGMSEKELAEYMTPEQQDASKIHDARYQRLGKDGQLEKSSAGEVQKEGKRSELKGSANGVNFKLIRRQKTFEDGASTDWFTGRMGEISLKPEDAQRLWEQFNQVPDDVVAESSARKARDSQLDYHDRHAGDEDRRREEQAAEEQSAQTQATYDETLAKLLGNKATEK